MRICTGSSGSGSPRRARFAVRFFALLLLAAPAWAKRPYEGVWEIAVERPGMNPDPATGTLVLERAGGSLRFDVVLLARRYALADFEVRGREIRFRLDTDEFDVRFELEVGRDELEGRCHWGRSWKVTGKRKDVKPQKRFEKGGGKGEYGGVAMDELIAKAEETGTDALVVIKDGEVVCDRTFGRPPGPLHIMSVTKFVAGIAVGLLVEEGKLDLDAPLSQWFPEWGEGDRASVTVRHLLTHTSGIETGENARTLNAQRDKVAYARGLGLMAKPGAERRYSNGGVALLSGVLEAAAREPVDSYLKRKLFDPLGIRDWKWDRDDGGHTVTYANLRLTARDLARIGWMVADGGGKVLKPETVALLASPATPLAKGQGLLWMLTDGGCYHNGWLGQWLCVYPSRKLVGVRLRAYRSEADAANAERGFGAFMTMLEALP